MFAIMALFPMWRTKIYQIGNFQLKGDGYALIAKYPALTEDAGLSENLLLSLLGNSSPNTNRSLVLSLWCALVIEERSRTK